MRTLSYHALNALFNVCMALVTVIGMIVFAVQSTHGDGTRHLMSREEEEQMRL